MGENEARCEHMKPVPNSEEEFVTTNQIQRVAPNLNGGLPDCGEFIFCTKIFFYK